MERKEECATTQIGVDGKADCGPAEEHFKCCACKESLQANFNMRHANVPQFDHCKT